MITLRVSPENIKWLRVLFLYFYASTDQYTFFPRFKIDPFVVHLAQEEREAFDSAKNHKRQRRKRQSVTAKREKSLTPKFV